MDGHQGYSVSSPPDRQSIVEPYGIARACAVIDPGDFIASSPSPIESSGRTSAGLGIRVPVPQSYPDC